MLVVPGKNIKRNPLLKKLTKKTKQKTSKKETVLKI